MRRASGLVARLTGCVALLVFASTIAVAQPASQGNAGNPPTGMSGAQGSMMGGGMGMEGMGMGGTGLSMGREVRGLGGIGMWCPGGIAMMQLMQKDPKLRGRMMELQGEMLRLMSDAMIQQGKELQKGK
jgi:hypothetical protein